MFNFLDINLLPSNSIGTVTLNDYTFQKFVDKSSKFVVVKFFVPWCPHCESFKEIFDEIVLKFLMEESEEVKFAESQDQASQRMSRIDRELLSKQLRQLV